MPCYRVLVSDKPSAKHFKFPVLFQIDIEPQQKERPRLGRGGRTFTPPKTRAFEEQISWLLKKAMANYLPYSGPLCVYVRFSFQKKVNSKARFPGRADIDNYLKAVLDGANEICWEDDSQILQVFTEKVWAPKGDVSSIILVIDRVREDTFALLCERADDVLELTSGVMQ